MIEYRTIDKTGWDDGPWQHEPDKIQYTDEVTGLPCLVKRHPRLGFLCGYVGVTEGHPLYRCGYGDGRVEALEVHHGVNYAAPCQDEDEVATSICHIPDPGEPDHVWWFGFDCGRNGDLAPGTLARDRELGFPTNVDWGIVYRTVEYVQYVNAKLARQLIAAGERT